MCTWSSHVIIFCDGRRIQIGGCSHCCWLLLWKTGSCSHREELLKIRLNNALIRADRPERWDLSGGRWMWSGHVGGALEPYSSRPTVIALRSDTSMRHCRGSTYNIWRQPAQSTISWPCMTPLSCARLCGALRYGLWGPCLTRCSLFMTAYCNYSDCRFPRGWPGGRTYALLCALHADLTHNLTTQTKILIHSSITHRRCCDLSQVSAIN